MESVLHIEPITRQSPAPLHIGHSQCLLYGETLTADEEYVGDYSSAITLGAPLCTMDAGSPQTCVPLVKTIEYTPDLSKKDGHIYLETVHYLKDKKFLVPFRSKIRSGMGQGLRFNHLPSLNLARQSITGYTPPVCDPRSEIVSDIVLHDEVFQKRQNQPLKEWLMHDLSTTLDSQPISSLSFDAGYINNMVPRYIHQVRSTPTEFNTRHLRDITSTIFPAAGLSHAIPASFMNRNPIGHHIRDVRDNLIPNSFDLRSFGNIPINRLERIEYNPQAFQHVCDLLDYIPLTDFNIDIVVSVDGDVVIYSEHLAVDRLSIFADTESGLYAPETIFRDYIAEYEITRILECFIKHHRGLTEEIVRIIEFDSIKIKFMKTITDEAAILLYRYDSRSDDPPLCGVYFDIALQSLAPMTVMTAPCAQMIDCTN